MRKFIILLFLFLLSTSVFAENPLDKQKSVLVVQRNPDGTYAEVYVPDFGLKMRLDYGTRTDGQPVYQGFASKGTAEGDNGWIIYKYTYDGDDNMLTKDIAFGNWTARATYTYE